MEPVRESSPKVSSDGSEGSLIAAARLEALGLTGEGTLGSNSLGTDYSNVPWDADSFPGYRITRELHRGGQGVVYQATHKGTKRRVAIKVMREGPFASATGRGRFEREMQILAQMDDPHIVGIHDGGEAKGFHYFVMDYVAGQPLDMYVGGMKWSLLDIVRLIEKVCSAVNAAHVRGVIHRDLKPSNILVDTQGEPRIVDFGLAKVVTGDVATDSQPEQVSITGQFIGSLPWASPEQAEGIPEKLDIRTDVYSLGVVFYQMLTGTFPYTVVGRMRDVLDNIQHENPQRPRAIRREVDDEIETIVLKCLSKERERRYQTAGELARDLQRYLADEPIEAKRDSGWYMLRKALRRYRTQVAVLSVFLVLAVASSIGMAVVYARAASAERTSHSIQAFLSDTLVGADPEEADAPDMTVLAAMQNAAGKVDDDLGQDPEVAAALHYLIGVIQRSRDNYVLAEHHFRRSLELRRALWGDRNSDTADSLHGLASTIYYQNDFETAERLYREAYQTRLALFGGRHEKIADSLNHIAAVYMKRNDLTTAEELFRRSLDMRRELFGASIPVARTANNLAKCLKQQSRFEEAEERYRESARVFEGLERKSDKKGRLRTAKVYASLGVCVMDAGRYDEAEELLRSALKVKIETAGADDPTTARTLFDLARLQLRREPPNLAQAREMATQALEARYSRLTSEKAFILNILGGALEMRKLQSPVGDHNIVEVLELLTQIERAESATRS